MYSGDVFGSARTLKLFLHLQGIRHRDEHVDGTAEIQSLGTIQSRAPESPTWPSEAVYMPCICSRGYLSHLSVYVCL